MPIRKTRTPFILVPKTVHRWLTKSPKLSRSVKLEGFVDSNRRLMKTLLEQDRIWRDQVKRIVEAGPRHGLKLVEVSLAPLNEMLGPPQADSPAGQALLAMEELLAELEIEDGTYCFRVLGEWPDTETEYFLQIGGRYYIYIQLT